MVVDGFESFAIEATKEYEELKKKYGKFAQGSWGDKLELNYQKMDKCYTELEPGDVRDRFLYNISL